MQKLLLPFFLGLFTLSLGQEASFEWAMEESSSDQVALGSDGSIYMVHSDNNFENNYLTKLNAQGNQIWKKDLGGSLFSLVIDNANNLYIAGTVFSFSSSSDMDPGSETHDISDGGFLLKLNSDGEFQWVNKLGINTYSTDITIDRNDSLVITGSCKGSLYYSSTLVADPPCCKRQGFVLKVSTSGELGWGKTFGESSRDLYVDGISTNSSSEIFLIGRAEDEDIDYDPGTGTAYLDEMYRGSYILKLSSTGEFEWVKGNYPATSGYVYNDYANNRQSIFFDSQDNIYTIGSFDGSIDFAPGSEEYVLSLDGYINAFIQKLDSNGDFVWAKRLGGDGYTRAFSGKIDSEDNIYITGSFDYEVDFDPDTSTFILDAGFGTNVFIEKLDKHGNFVWAKQLEGENSKYQEGKHITVDASDNLYVSGTFQGKVDFNPHADSSFLTTDDYQTSTFIVKMSPCEVTAPTLDIPSLAPLQEKCPIEAPLYPTATSSCGEPIIGVPNVTFPIIDKSISSITWTYDAGYDQVTTQKQDILWLAYDTIEVEQYVENAYLSIDYVYADVQWLDCNNNMLPIIESDNSLYFYTYTSGSFTAVISQTYNDCIDTLACTTISFDTSSLGFEEHKDILFSVSPNPSTDGLFTITAEDKIMSSVSVINELGKIVFESTDVHSSGTTINLGDQSGVFILKIEHFTGTEFQTLISY